MTPQEQSVRISALLVLCIGLFLAFVNNENSSSPTRLTTANASNGGGAFGFSK